jgi:hypothetical protein
VRVAHGSIKTSTPTEMLGWGADLECGGKHRGPQRGTRAGVVVARHRFGSSDYPKRRRRFTLPAHSKFIRRPLRGLYICWIRDPGVCSLRSLHPSLYAVARSAH